MNVEGNLAARDELKRLGVPLVPAMAIGDQVVHRWNPRSFAERLGIPYSEEPQLSPKELYVKLNTILQATTHAILPLSPEHLKTQTPGGERTLCDWGYHIFRLSIAYRDAAVENRFPEAWLLETVPSELTDGVMISSYGAWVCGQFASWFEENKEASLSQTVYTYYGPQSLLALLECTTWHAARHLRQIYTLLEGVGIAPNQPLTAEDYKGLPALAALW